MSTRRPTPTRGAAATTPTPTTAAAATTTTTRSRRTVPPLSSFLRSHSSNLSSTSGSDPNLTSTAATAAAAAMAETTSETSAAMAQAIVLEFGSSCIRIGISGVDHKPRHVLPCHLPFPSSLPAFQREANRSLSVTRWENILHPLLCHVYTDLLLLRPTRGVIFGGGGTTTTATATTQHNRVVVIEPSSIIAPAAFRLALCKVLLMRLYVPSVLFVCGGMITVPYALGVIHSGGGTTNDKAGGGGGGSGSLWVVVDVGTYEGRVCVVEGNGRYLFDTFQVVPCGYDSLASSLMSTHNNADNVNARIPSLADARFILAEALRHLYENTDETAATAAAAAAPTAASDGTTIPLASLSSSSAAATTTTTTTTTTTSSIRTYHIPSNARPIQIDSRTIQNLTHEFYYDYTNPDSLIHALLSCILQCPLDARKHVVRNIVFIGGAVSGIPHLEMEMLRGVAKLLKEREEEEKRTKGTGAAAGGGGGGGGYNDTRNVHSAKFIAKLGPILSDMRIVTNLPFPKSTIAWVGGSIMGALNLDVERWVHRRTFMEWYGNHHDDEQKRTEGKRGGVKEEKKVDVVGVGRRAGGIYDFLSISSRN